MLLSQTAIRAYWFYVARQYGVQNSLTWSDFLQYVLDQYSDPIRKYHSLQHPIEMLSEFKVVRSMIERPESFILKVLGHDLIYTPSSSKNEENSGAAMASAMEAVGFPRGLVEDVYDGILSTKNHQSDDSDNQFLITLDLARLGGDPDAFRRFGRLLEEEYSSFYTAEQYLHNRLRWAHTFLKRKPIFPNPYGIERYEKQTEENLNSLISELEWRLARP